MPKYQVEISVTQRYVIEVERDDEDFATSAAWNEMEWNRDQWLQSEEEMFESISRVKEQDGEE
jgi:hypothetical protein